MFPFPRIPIVGVLAAVLMFALAVTSARAGPVCLSHDVLAARLQERFSERPIGRGLDRRGVVLEIFAAPSGSFTLIVVQPDGLACVIAVGEAWQMPGGPPSGA